MIYEADYLKWADETWDRLQNKLGAEARRMGNKIPYSPENGVYSRDWGAMMPDFWTNGFWGGIMWQMYDATGEELYRERARNVSAVLNPLLLKAGKLHHDVGFMWLPTAVADYKINRNEEAREYALHAAVLLAGRYNPEGQFIRAWNNEGREGWAIIDTLMNLSLLFWAGDETKDIRFSQIAVRHAKKAAENHMRPDGSVYHIVAYHPENGEVESYPDGQGYSAQSAWARGTAWAIYGFANSYRHTGEQCFLDASKRAAHFFIANAACSDWRVLCDFRAPEEPVVWDTTAAVCAASGMLELADIVPDLEKSLYRDSGTGLPRWYPAG